MTAHILGSTSMLLPKLLPALVRAGNICKHSFLIYKYSESIWKYSDSIETKILPAPNAGAGNILIIGDE